MSGWTAKRFWTTARAEACDGGYSVRLDARPVKTPAKAPLVVPTLSMAQAIAEEWDAQTGVIDPTTMPVTRAANSAIDKITPQFNDVAGLIVAYGGSDLICYRADAPPGLVARQADAWDPMIAWSATVLNAPLLTTTGVIPVSQPAASLAQFQSRVLAMDPFRLAGFHDLVAISGSLVLALAVTHEALTVEEAWARSRIDETWQQELWGDDDDALANEANRRRGFLDAARFYQLCG